MAGGAIALDEVDAWGTAAERFDTEKAGTGVEVENRCVKATAYVKAVED